MICTSGRNPIIPTTHNIAISLFPPVSDGKNADDFVILPKVVKCYGLQAASSSHVKCGVSNLVFYILIFYHCNTRIVVLVFIYLCILDSLKMVP